MTPDETASRRLHFRSGGDPQEVATEVQQIETFLLEAGCAVASVQQMAIVAEEILTNIVREAWSDGASGYCAVDVSTVPDEDAIVVTLRTEDDGIEFDPTAAAEPDLEASLEERSIGGLGILLVKRMTDSQTYQRIDGRNVFEVRKRCPIAKPPG